MVIYVGNSGNVGSSNNTGDSGNKVNGNIM